MQTQTQSEKPSQLSAEELADVANWNAGMDGMIARGMERVRQHKEQLVSLGLYDQEGNKLTDFVPYDMRPGSGSDVGG